MPTLTFHLEAAPGTDLAAAAAELQKEIAALEGVESVEAVPHRYQGMSLPEIVATITIATTAVQGLTLLLKRINTLLDESAKTKKKLATLMRPTVEVGVKKKRIDKLSAADLKEIAEA